MPAGSRPAATVLLHRKRLRAESLPSYFKEKGIKAKPPTPPEKHTDFGLRYCYPPSNSVEVSDGVCCSPRKPSEDYFVLDPGSQAPFELPAPPVTKEQPRCPIWSFGDTPWFSKGPRMNRRWR